MYVWLCGLKGMEDGVYEVQDLLVAHNRIPSEQTSRRTDAEANYCPQSWEEHKARLHHYVLWFCRIYTAGIHIGILINVHLNGSVFIVKEQNKYFHFLFYLDSC